MTRPGGDPQADAQIARVARRIGAELQELAEQMTRHGWKPDGYENADIAEMGNVLKGMAIRIALGFGDAALVNEVAGGRAS